MTSSATAEVRSADRWRPRFRLIVADPDVPSSDLLADLALSRVDVEACRTGGEALLAAATKRPDAALIAGVLVDVSSAEVVRLLVDRIGIPVLVGAGGSDLEHAKPALEAGACTHVLRPYRVGELLPLLRSFRPEAIADLGPPIRCGSLSLDPATAEVTLRGRPIRLPLREFDLLRFFMDHADRLVTREQIFEAVWGGTSGVASNTLTVHIKRLRARLGDDQRDPRIILTVRGLGYRFVPPV